MEERFEQIFTQLGQHMQEHRKVVNEDVLRLINDHMSDSRSYFDREKADFLQAIQENMLILDAMLKQYAYKSSQQATNNGERITSQGSTSTAQQLLLTIQENDEDYMHRQMILQHEQSMPFDYQIPSPTSSIEQTPLINGGAVNMQFYRTTGSGTRNAHPLMK